MTLIQQIAQLEARVVGMGEVLCGDLDSYMLFNSGEEKAWECSLLGLKSVGIRGKKKTVQRE